MLQHIRAATAKVVIPFDFDITYRNYSQIWAKDVKLLDGKYVTLSDKSYGNTSAWSVIAPGDAPWNTIVNHNWVPEAWLDVTDNFKQGRLFGVKILI